MLLSRENKETFFDYMLSNTKPNLSISLFPFHDLKLLFKALLFLISFPLKLTSSTPCVFCQGSLTISSFSLAYPLLPLTISLWKTLITVLVCFWRFCSHLWFQKPKIHFQWQKLQFINTTRVWLTGEKSLNGGLLVLICSTRWVDGLLGRWYANAVELCLTVRKLSGNHDSRWCCRL